MACRNIDRLMTMMAPKEFPDHVKTIDNVLHTLQALDNCVHYGFGVHDPGVKNTGLGLPGSIEATRMILAHLKDGYTADDVFARIAVKPKGEDGTVLASIRDLRRYLMLVEAEMIAEGVVQNEVDVGAQYPQDVYAMIADEQGVNRQVVKDLIHDLFYTSVGQIAQDILRGVKTAVASADIPAASPVHASDPGPAIGGAFEAGLTLGRSVPITEKDVTFPEARELSPTFDSVFVSGKVHTIDGARAPTPEELTAMGRAGPPTSRPVSKDENFAKPCGGPSPENGSQHASTVPWEIGLGYHGTLVARVGVKIVSEFYSARAAQVWRLEPVVSGSHKCPREIKDCYDFCPLLTDDGEPRWVLRRDQVPAELDDQFPRLQHEMNRMEFEQSDTTYRFMYQWVEGPQKWCLLPQFQSWARQA
jgi:hypothetical protein